MDDTHDQITEQPAKISFKDLCLQLGIGDGALDDIDWMADVPAGTFWSMFLGRPVSLKLAEKALFALSEHDGETRWTLNSVAVSLLPTPQTYFVEAFRDCPMDYQTLVALAAQAGITQTVIDCMTVGKPVYRVEAERLAQCVEELREVAGEEAVRHVLTRLGETMPEEALPVVTMENHTHCSGSENDEGVPNGG